MSKLTKLTALTTVMALGTVTLFSAAVNAAEAKKTKEITKIIGYNVTEKTEQLASPKGKAFVIMDTDGNGVVNFKEYRNHSLMENEAETFGNIDTNQDKFLSLDEYVNYSDTKGNTEVESELHGKMPVKGTNIKSRAYVEKEYYVPVEPKVVDVKPINNNY